MTHPSDDPRPTTDERYTSATHAKNLKMETEKIGAIDLLTAAAWSPRAIGSALLRLHSEWDGCQHPRRIKREALEALALTLQGFTRDRDQKAKRIANDWYEHEVRLMLQRLKSLPLVRALMVAQAEKWMIEDADRTVAGVLIWWLDHTCPTCNGLKFEKFEGAPALSAIRCRHCHGAGEIPTPYSFEGRRLAGFIQDCLNDSRRFIRKVLRP